MLIKTIVDNNHDDAFVESLTKEASTWYVHTTYISDCESSTDAGDGREDYTKEGKDLEISLDECVVMDGKFSGVICKAFGQEDYVLTTNPEVCIDHPGNYGGSGYHYYRSMYFDLLKKQ